MYVADRWPFIAWGSVSWGVAPGYYVIAPLALLEDPLRN